MEEKQIIPYGQHFRCFPQMIGGPNNQSVFMYLMDEYVARLRAGKKTSFKLVLRDIERRQRISFVTVKNTIESLKESKLISVDDNLNCTVHGERFVALIETFHSLEERKRASFSKYLLKGEYDALEEFGFEEASGDVQVLKNLSGNIIQNGEVLKNLSSRNGHEHQVLKNLSSTHDIFSEVLKNLSSKTESETQMLKNLSIWKHLNIEVLKNLSTLCDTYGVEVLKNLSRSAEEFKQLVNFVSTLENSEVSEVNDAICSHVGAEIFKQRCLNSSAEPLKFLSTEINNKENKEEKFATFGCSQKGDKSPKEFLEGILENDRNIDDDIPDRKNNFESFFNPPEILEINSFLQKERDDNPDYEKNIQEFEEKYISQDSEKISMKGESYEAAKERRKLPFISSDEVERIISDKTYCLDRADKIFINQVWETLGEVLSYDKEDEKGNLVEVKVDPEDYVFPVDRIIPDILNPAFEATEDIIQEGYWEINGATCEVTAEPLSSDDVRRIIDFPVINDSLSGFGYKISKTAFRNIFEKAIELAPEEEKLIERAKDQEYLRLIVYYGDGDEREQLTPIEKAIYKFMDTFYDLDQDGAIIEPKNDNWEISQQQLQLFRLELKKCGVTEDDLVNALRSGKNQFGGLNISLRPFSWRKIKYWNDFKALRSIISVEGIREYNYGG